MYAKFLILVFATLVASREIKQKASNNVSPRDIFDDVELLFTTYKSTVEEVVTAAENDLKGIQRDILDTSRAVFSVSERIISLAKVNFLRQIEDIEQSATEADVDATVCTFEAKEEMNEYPDTIIKEINQCILEKREEDEAVIKDSLAKLEGTRNTVEEFRGEIDGCVQANNQVCAMTVLSQLTAQNNFLPDVIEQDIEEVRQLFDNLQLSFQECSTSKRNQLTLEGRLAIDEAKRCVDELIP